MTDKKTLLFMPRPFQTLPIHDVLHFRGIGIDHGVVGSDPLMDECARVNSRQRPYIKPLAIA